MIGRKYFSYLMPSIADVIFVSLFLLLAFSAGKYLLLDADTGYHIRAGDYIIDTVSIPKEDIFSFITPTLHWTAHEWLSEVIMALVHKVSGLTGVVLLFSFIISVVYYLFFRMIRAEENNIVLAILVVLLVVVSSMLHWLARPHIFSLLLTLIWYYLLDQYQYHDRNYLYVLPATMLLWVNLHGGYMAGFVLIGVYLIGNGIQYITASKPERDGYKKKVLSLGLIAAACLIVSLVNPYTYKILLFPFELMSNEYILDRTMEFMSPNFHKVMPFKYLLLLMVAVFAISRSRVNWIELLLVLLFLNMSLYSVRYIPLFGIVAAPILLKQMRPLQNLTGGKMNRLFRTRAENIAKVDASAKGYLWPISSVFLVVSLAAGGIIRFEFDPEIKPVAAVEFLKNEHINGNMYDKGEFGDYIIYAAWPGYKVFFDGRSDMYGADIAKEYFEVAEIRPKWSKVLEKYDVKWIIIAANSVLSRFLMERHDWKLIYADKVAVIFVRDIPENRYLIEKYRDVELVVNE